MSEGYTKAKEVSETLKTQTEQEKVAESQEMEQAKNSLVAVRNNPALMKLYQDNADLGSQNLGSDLPILKIHTANKSKNNTLENGQEPNDGWFYYRPAKSQYEEVYAHILTISRGFRADGVEGKKNVFNQILGGVIVNDGDMKPFLMYFTGMKLQNLWNFGKEAGKYTKNKKMPIPLFALTVKMSVEKVEHDFGKSPVVVFEIQEHQSGFPDVVTDESMFIFLRNNVSKMEETIDNLISSKATEETDTMPPQDVTHSEQNKDDIPF